MQYRQLGQSQLDIAPLALGGNVFGWTADEDASFRILDAFVAAGCNLIDTADGYSHWADGHEGGESEAMIGKWLRASGKREQVLIATKVGKWSKRPGLGRANIRAAVDESLARLNTDVIDLYQAHADDENTPLEETLAAFAELIEAGKVRAIGASNYSAPRLAEALEVSAKQGLPRYESVQPEYNLLRRQGYEDGMQDLVQEKKVGVISYFSLAAGFLTGKYRSTEDLAGRARGGMVEDYVNAHGLRVLRAVDDVAER
ncbi:MAG: aldo/keto reductase, partial [Rhodanobacteraceae bacterium]